MAFKVLLRKLQVMKLKRFLSRAIADRGSPKKASSWMGISHGYHLVERSGSEASLIAQREQIETSEVWLFGAFDQDMGGLVSKYLQANLFDKHLSEDQIERKAKETMKKAYISTRAKMQAQEEAHEMGGFTTAIVMNGERFVAADFGGYKTIVCRAGVGIQIGGRHQNRQKRQRFLSSITGKLFGHKGDHKPNTSATPVIITRRVEPETEFIILASDGIWEVLRDQEAVDLISHIVDAQEAAECLAKEAFNRMSKSTISCIVIRFG